MRDEDWGPAILEACRAERPTHRMYLYVDRDVLASVSGLTPPEAVDAFTGQFNGRRFSRPFGRAADDMRAWVRAGSQGHPPCVDALAMTVLAVTEEPIGGAAGVYPRQNQLLGLPPVASEPDGYRVDVTYLWDAFNVWLAKEGQAYGLPSAFTRLPWTWQGWARSQAIIRHRDRVIIEDFLHHKQVAPGSTMGGPESLLLQFFAWLQTRGQRGSAFAARITDEPSRQVLQDVLQEELGRWEGAPRDRTRGGTMRGLLTYDDWDGLGAALRLDDGLWGQPIDTGQGHYAPEERELAVRILLDVPPVELLERGHSRPVTTGRRMRIGGEAVYALYDDVELGTWVQVRTSVHGRRYRVLGPFPRMTALAQTLGLPPPVPGPACGWVFLDQVPSDASPEALRAAGLGALVPPPPRQAVLQGGLPLGNGTYLGGGEPDLRVPAGVSAVVVDEQVVSLPTPSEPGAASVLCLRDLFLDPQDHAVKAGTETLRFRTVTHLHEVAVSGETGWGEPLGASEAERLPGLEGCVLSGADLRVPQPPAAVTTSVPSGHELLALLEDGRLIQVTPRTPGWLARVGLDAFSVDVQTTFRGCGPVAFVLTRSPHSGAIRATAVPPGLECLPGNVQPVARHDLLGEVTTREWTWATPPNPDRKKLVLGRAFGIRPTSQPAPARTTSRVAPPVRRADIAQAPVENAYDDVLGWLSERAQGRAPAQLFAETWSWACHRSGRSDDAEQWRLAAMRLVALGHCERDYRRQQLAVAPAILMDLPGASGLSLLVGARPRQLLERLLDDHDSVEAVAAASSDWDLQSRVQLTRDGLPDGPAAVYVHWDRRSATSTSTSLAALGAHHVGVTADSLLGALQPLVDTLARATVLTTSPSSLCSVRVRSGPLRYTWEQRASDVAAGFYRYRLPHGDVFAWRSALAGPLVKVDRHTGIWLDLRAQEPDGVVGHHVTRACMLVPRMLPLPPLVSRALHLRTGLPPWRLDRHRLEGRGDGQDYWVFENVHPAAAERVAHLLGQPERDVNDLMEPT